jgi:hypothetical protein
MLDQGQQPHLHVLKDTLLLSIAPCVIQSMCLEGPLFLLLKSCPRLCSNRKSEAGQRNGCKRVAMWPQAQT